MKWFPPNESEGKGDYTGNVLTIYFTFPNGAAGIVKYTRSTRGEMNGTWWMDATPSNKGTEELTPILVTYKPVIPIACGLLKITKFSCLQQLLSGQSPCSRAFWQSGV